MYKIHPSHLLLFFTLFLSITTFAQNTDEEIAEPLEYETEEYELYLDTGDDVEELEPSAPNSFKKATGYKLPDRKKAPKIEKYTENGKLGLSRGTKKLTPAIYDYIDYNGWWTGRTVTVKKDGKYGMVDSTGAELIPAIYKSVYSLDNLKGLFGGSEDLYIVHKDNKAGIVNYKHEFLVPLIYDDISETENKCYSIRKGTKEGLMNAEFEIILEPKYEEVWWFEREVPVFLFWNDSLGGLIHADGRKIEGLKQTDILPIASSQGSKEPKLKPIGLPKKNRAWYALQSEDEKWGAFDMDKFQWVLKPQFNAITQVFSEAVQPYFIVNKNGKYGMVDYKNQVQLDCKYDTLFFDQLPLFPLLPYDMIWTLPITASLKGKMGLLKSDGTALTKFMYNEISCIFQDKAKYLFKAKKGETYTLIDRKGKEISKNKFDYISDFLDTVAFAQYKGELGIVNTKGEFSPEEIEPFPTTGFKTKRALALALLEAAVDPNKREAFVEKATLNKYALGYLKNSMHTGDKVNTGAYYARALSEYDLYGLQQKVTQKLERHLRHLRLTPGYKENTIVSPDQSTSAVGDNSKIRVDKLHVLPVPVYEGINDDIRSKLILRIDGYWYLVYPPENY